MKTSSWLTNGLLVLVLLLCSCKPRVPYKYIQPDKMEDILYDYHIAEAMANDYEHPRDTLLLRVYKNAILEKYGCNEEEFDASMVYYTRHADRLHKIYENLSERLNNTAISLGGSVSELNRYGSLSATGDTANVWNGDRSFVLLHHPAFNKYSFKVDADTTFHAGDKVVLHFNSQFIFQDGMRDAIVILAMKLSNDSVINRNMHVAGSSAQSLEVYDDKRLGIKEVKGFFLLNNNLNRASENQTTMKIIVVNQISLIRMHTPKPESSMENEAVDTHNESERIVNRDTNYIPNNPRELKEPIGNPQMSQPQPLIPSGRRLKEEPRVKIPNNQLK